MTRAGYPGPVRGEPLPIELHNTLFAAARGERHDGIDGPAALAAWLTAVAGDLPVPAQAVDATRLPEFLALRDAVRSALHASLNRKPIAPSVRLLLNDATAACPGSTEIAKDGARRTRYHAADATTIVLAAIAHETIALVTGRHTAQQLRACNAPGCVLLFLRDHPRRAWCSPACGNRARQARHYARHRDESPRH